MRNQAAKFGVGASEEHNSTDCARPGSPDADSGRSADALALLLHRTGEGDRAAFEALYARAAPGLFALCMRTLRRQVLAEEVLQEAFVQIWLDARHYDVERAAAMTWMGRIVRHRAIDLLRAGRGETEAASEDFELDAAPDLSPGPLERSLARARSEALQYCLDTLSALQREALLFAFFRGFTHVQVARALDTPLGTVKARIRTGMQRLRECLER